MIQFEANGTRISVAESDREWALFFLLLVSDGAEPFGLNDHIDWIRGRPFVSPDEWLGQEGARFRARYSMREPSPEFIVRWRAFKHSQEQTSLAEIDRVVGLFVDVGGTPS